MIAGLEDISGGNLFIDGDYMNDVAPKDRGIAMVFQSYALYPHMTVYNNLAYPLKIMHLNKAEIDRRVMAAAKILQIETLLDRKPKALSGGQRQRVALGRAIVKHAKVLLMDEPLSNLDAKLRVQMRSEIVSLHRKLNATTIYVTHDQTEAMTMASRIVIMKDGYVQQIGTPIEVFNHPVNKFVAGFIGSPSMNFFDVTYKDGVVTFASGETLRIPDELLAGKVIPEHVILGLRPENIHNADSVRGSEHPDANFTVTVRLAELLGNEYYIHAPFGGIDMVARFPSDKNIQTGDTVTVNFSQKRVHLFNPETEEALF
jgi:multiple sugar transport system ATP-binding protein